MTFFQLGNLTIPSIWLAVLIAVGVTTGFYRFVLKQRLGSWFSDAVFYYILVWKFSYIVLNFSMFLDYPLGALYFNGGRVGHLLALGAVTVLLWYKAKKEQIRPTFLVVWMLFYFLYKASYYSLEQEWLLAVAQAVLVIVFAVFVHGHRIAMTAQLYVAFFVVQLLWLSVERTLVSVEGLTFSWLFLFGLVNWIDGRKQ